MKIGRKKICIILGTTTGIIKSLFSINPYSATISLTEAILQLSGSKGNLSLSCSWNDLIRFMLIMFPEFLATIYYWAGVFYQYYCTAGVYIFSRQQDRKKWYVDQLIKMIGELLIYIVVSCITSIAICFFRYTVLISIDGLILMMIHIIFNLLWLFFWICLMNFLSVFFGSATAFTVIWIILALNIAILGFIGTLEKNMMLPLLRKALLTIDLISHIVLAWHKWNISSSEIINNRYSLSLPLSFFTLTFLAGLSAYICGLTIIKHDILSDESEVSNI